MKTIAALIVHAILVVNICGLGAIDARVYGSSATVIQQPQQVSEFSACAYASLQAAITAIGDKRVTLQVTCNIDVVSTFTIPENINLAISGPGRFTISSGQVLRILGGMQAQLQRIFYGDGKVSFLDSRSVGSVHQKEVWANWWGVIGDENADDTSAINTAFEATSSGMTLLFPFNFRMKVTGFVGPTNKRNIRVAGSSPIGSGVSPGTNIPYFVWYGPDGGGPVFRVRDVRDSLFENFAVFGAPHTTGFEHGADRIMDINQDQQPGAEITTNNDFRNLAIQANSNRTTSVGIYIGDQKINTRGYNCEFQRFFNCTIRAGVDDNGYLYSNKGTAVYIYGNNTKSLVFEDCEILTSRIGIHCKGGSFYSLRTHGYGVGRVFEMQYWTEPITIENSNFEILQQFMFVPSGGGTSAPITIKNCRWGDWSDGSGKGTNIGPNAAGGPNYPLISMGDMGGTLILEANGFGIETSHMTHRVWGENSTQNALIAIGNDFYSENVPELLSFGHVSLIGNKDMNGEMVTSFHSHFGRGGQYQIGLSNNTTRNAIGTISGPSYIENGYSGGNVDDLVIGDGEVVVSGVSRASGLSTSTGLAKAVIANDTNETDTVIKVESTKGFPASGRIIIDQGAKAEYCEYTGLTSDSFTGVGRTGAVGYAKPVAHSKGRTITFIPLDQVRIFSIIGRDANGNRGFRSEQVAGAGFKDTELTDNNFIAFSWPAMPNVVSYDIIETDRSAANRFRLIANVKNATSYKLTSPSSTIFGSYSMVYFDESGVINFNSRVRYRNILTLAKSDATPSVSQGNLFETANSSATSITNFTNGLAGQEIYVMCGDTNTTIVNGAFVKLNGSNFTCSSANGVLRLIFDGSKWREVSRSAN